MNAAEDALRRENEWLRRLLLWCRPRLHRDPYRHQLDRYLAKGPSEPDGAQIVLSEELTPLPPLPEEDR